MYHLELTLKSYEMMLSTMFTLPLTPASVELRVKCIERALINRASEAIAKATKKIRSHSVEFLNHGVTITKPEHVTGFANA
jgi:hypothetical protein